MDIFDQYAADPAKELEGVWDVLGTDPKTQKVARILVARSGNKRHGKVITQLYEANKSTLDLKNDDADAKGEEITIEAMAKGVFLGWEGLSFKKEPVPDSATLSAEERLKWAKKLLAVKDFRARVQRVAEDFQKYKAVQDEEAAGN